MKKIILSFILFFSFLPSVLADNFYCNVKAHAYPFAENFPSNDPDQWKHFSDDEWRLEIKGNTITKEAIIMDMVFEDKFIILEDDEIATFAMTNPSTKDGFDIIHLTLIKKSNYIITTSHNQFGITINQGSCIKF